MRGDRPADLKYLIQLAQAAEINGFEAVLTPTGLWCEDAWLTTAMLIGSTESLKYLVAFRPGLISPTLAAQMATTFQWQSQGRLMLNVVTGGESIEQRAFGDFLEKQDRYARCGEFLDIVRRLWTSESPVTAAGEHLRVEQASLARRPDPLPPVFFGGSSPEAGQVAAQYADTYLTWGERPEQVKEKLDWIRGLAAAQGRQLSYGLRVHVISRDTSEQAWAEAERLLNGLSPETVAAAQQSLARSESVGQRRMRQLHGGGEDYTAGVGCPTAGDLSQPVVGRRSGARRRGHRPGRLARRGRRSHRRIRRAGAGALHPVRISPPRGGLHLRRGRPPDPR